jgi:coenzyme F420 hydrogenase subunit beta
MPHIKKLADVVDWRLCIGCGACAYICPDDRVRLVDFFAEGIRPVIAAGDCKDCVLCLDVCPAVHTDFRLEAPPSKSRPGNEPTVDDGFTKDWGQILEVWEGHASDAGIRFKGSSGGVLTALAAYCVEKAGMHGVLHTGQDPADPIRNRTRLSRTRSDLLAATGSRYSPASVCNGLGLVEAAPKPCAIIGKPAEIAAVRNAARLRPELDRNVGVTMSFFCAESPSTRGTVELLENLDVDPASVRDLRYRGHGWPGHFAITRAGDTEPCQKMTYRESWGFLQTYRPWSVRLWPDGSGELADISCGDPWYEEPDGKNPGFSLVVVRTERGREIVEAAMAAGYVSLQPAERWKLAKSQSGMLAKKGSIWGRRVALHLFGLPITRFDELDLRHCWKPLAVQEKLRAILGTIRRILTRKLYRRLKLDAHRSKPVGEPIPKSATRRPITNVSSAGGAPDATRT